jgi:uncharacterized membrane protein
MIYAGRLDGVLVGAADYYFRRDTTPAGSYDWWRRAPFLWTEADGIVMLDRFLADADSSDPSFVTDDGSVVIGSYVSSEKNETGVFRWTRGGGASKLGPTGGIAQPVQFWSSENGDVVILRHLRDDGSSEVVRWSTESSLETISDDPRWPAQAEIEQLSADGSTIIGVDLAGDSERMFRWAAEGAELLGGLPGLPNCYAAVSTVPRDGKVIFGSCASADPERSTRKAFRWSEADGMKALENEDQTCFMRMVEAVSGDGKVAFGRALCGADSRLMRWSTRGVDVPATMGLSFESSGVSDVDASGQSACGSVCEQVTGDESRCTGFRWNTDIGYVRLPIPSGQDDVAPRAVDPTGRIVVGLSEIVNGSSHAMLWDSSGALDIQAYLTSQGVDLRSRPLSMAHDVVIQGESILVRGRGASDGPYGEWIARIPLAR